MARLELELGKGNNDQEIEEELAESENYDSPKKQP
jgi:hypothetical protein